MSVWYGCRFLHEVLEVLECVLIQADRNRLLQPLRVRIRTAFRKVITLLHGLQLATRAALVMTLGNDERAATVRRSPANVAVLQGRSASAAGRSPSAASTS